MAHLGRTVERMAITGITRRALFKLLADGRWWGECADEVEFLERLYRLDDLKSHDQRFATFREDLVQHRIANPDWSDQDLLMDQRLRLSAADDEPLLAFLAETVHPEVCDNRTLVAQMVDEYNVQLRPDGWELFESTKLSGRPVFSWRPVKAPEVTLEQFREAIAVAVSSNFKSYDVERICVAAGLPPSTDEWDDPDRSKRFYVRRRVDEMTRSELLDVAERLQELFEDDDLQAVVDAARASTPQSKLSPVKQLLFASTGPKPEIVLKDAISNDLQVVANAESCLEYNEPVHDSGLTWRQLIRWWSPACGVGEERPAGLALHKRLLESLSPGPEQLMLTTYAKLYGEFGYDLPALLPQVYLHYDPYSQRRAVRPLVRQRMDFLLLLPGRRRAVIELDGKQHYANERGMAAPERYAEMVREDRRLKLSGYDIFRIGGHELTDPVAGEAMLKDFYMELLGAYDVSIG